MRVRILVLVMLVVVGVVLAFGGTAHAKGPSGAEITGEGIPTPIAVGRDSLHANLVEETGLYAAVFGQEPNSMLAVAPGGELGPRFAIAWSLPWSDGGPTTVDQIDQDLYPYADGGPVVYTTPGQTFYGSERTRGGWFRAPATLVARMQTLGVPELDAIAPPEPRATVAPRAEATANAGLPLLPIGASLGLVFVATALVLILWRRRTMTSTPT